MWLQIIDLDFDASRVHVEVAPGNSEECLARLDAFVATCTAEKIAEVRLHYRQRTLKRDVTRLEDFASTRQLPAPTPSPQRTQRSGDGGDCPRFRCEIPRRRRRPKESDIKVRYQLRIDSCHDTPDRLHRAVRLIGASVDLDPRSALQLRLCVYELATNTVEHATFTTDTPAICLELAFTNHEVSVLYRDNSTVFLTDNTAEVDLIEEQIHSSSKRGLGLYLLNKLCSDFHYERKGDWNETTFLLGISRERTSITVR